jgi:hypothetical protein
MHNREKWQDRVWKMLHHNNIVKFWNIELFFGPYTSLYLIYEIIPLYIFFRDDKDI